LEKKLTYTQNNKSSTLGRSFESRVACLRVQNILDSLDWSKQFPNLRWETHQALEAMTDGWQGAPRWYICTCQTRHAVRARNKQAKSMPHWGAAAFCSARDP